MSTQESVETERKYDADLETPLPAFEDIAGVEQVADPADHQLEAVYFDTEGLILAKHRITLRRRTGGTDSGWHLKLPAERDNRVEIHAPLGQPEIVPEELAERLLVFTRGDELRPVARIHTRRTLHRLHGSEDVTLADFVDDHVTAETLHPTQLERQWREWEIELVHGDEALFESADRVLSGAGATPSGHASKLARAFGTSWPAAVPAPPKARPKGSAGDAIVAYIAAQIAEITQLDSGVRQGADDAVHGMRSATRRLRSTLSAYGKLFDADAADQLKTELKWLGKVLGKARDAEVLRDRIGELMNEQPDGLVPASAASRINDELETAFNSGYRNMLRSLGTKRYFRLLESLEEFRDEPPTKPRAGKKARPVTAKLAGRAIKRLRRSQKAAAGQTGVEGDRALHQVRKDAKRLRHAAEALADVHKKPAVKLARNAQKIQKVLGEHQDSVVSRSILLRLASDTDGSVEDNSPFAPLLAAEEQRAADSGARYEKLAKKRLNSL
ncbi:MULTISPECIES: CYTH and CHAD domain-containing protein [Arthrobacter]|jgi:CHAD domain-containing protein|uniref:CYTH and CHAD domain-containing protein n=1 Tax=Arthrobacter TaxID=1663 RepID=UPI0027863B51|nr:CYTH and CHAD domain-containing protein [Arthrobacter bambusae]MDQ0240540.1 CHAD domain-containing protein [Arthrobacter bambusae]